MPWEDLFKPTIELCENGFKIPRALSNALVSAQKHIRKNKVLSGIFVNKVTGELYKHNDTVKFPLLAKTLRIISKSNSSDVFYNGILTGLVVAEINENGTVKSAVGNFKIPFKYQCTANDLFIQFRVLTSLMSLLFDKFTVK